MDDLHSQIVSEIRGITTHIEAWTGLKSNWNGQLEFAPTEAGFRGLKPFTCSILLRVDLAPNSIRWRTLIHEAFHAFSAGYNRIDFTQNIGWEEGLVEQLQRMFRLRILTALDVGVNESLFHRVEQTHPFNIYIKQLQLVQQTLGVEEETFYFGLLATPIKLRYQYLLQQAMQQGNRAALYALSAARPIMEATTHDTIANSF